jgi:uncharacterized membrane protein YcaP (DUF421 family)
MQEHFSFAITAEMVFWGLVSAVLVFVLTIFLTRIFGLRSYARLSTFDFAFTLAKGALIASIAINDDIGFFEGAVALLTIYAAEWITGSLRNRYSWFNRLVSNRPVLLMYKGQYIEKNIRATRISMDDLYFALRQSNISQMADVQAIVAESTGQISVLTCDTATVEKLLEGVRR